MTQCFICCPVCSREIPNNSTFCLHCGSRVEGYLSPELLLIESQVEQLQEECRRLEACVIEIAEKRRRFHEEYEKHEEWPNIREGHVTWFETFHERQTQRLVTYANTALHLLSILSVSSILPAKTAERIRNICQKVTSIEMEQDAGEVAPRYRDMKNGLHKFYEQGYIPHEIEKQFSQYASLFDHRK